MSETITENPPRPILTPLQRVTQWQPTLEEHGWHVETTHTGQRARLDAVHPSGATAMVTSGSAGRTRTNGRTQLYALQTVSSTHLAWVSTRAPGFEDFIRTRTLVGGRRMTSKCRCRTRADRRKTRYVTEPRARQAMEEARRHRTADGQAETAECRVYRCPDDDRVWHVTSRAVWRDEPGDSALWNAQ